MITDQSQHSYEAGSVALHSARSTWEIFLDKYAANFRPLSERDGLPEWRSVVESVDPETVILALENLIREKTTRDSSGKNTPRLIDLQSEIFSIRRARAGKTKYVSFKTCGLCENFGWLQVVTDQHNTVYDAKNGVYPSGKHYINFIPCRCDSGLAANERHFGDLSRGQPERYSTAELDRLARMALPFYFSRAAILRHIEEAVGEKPDPVGIGLAEKREQ